MAPLLFNILFSLMLHVAFKGCDKGVYIRFCTDSGIFNLRQMSAKTKGKELLSWDYTLADDCAHFSHTRSDIQPRQVL